MSKALGSNFSFMLSIAVSPTANFNVNTALIHSAMQVT